MASRGRTKPQTQSRGHLPDCHFGYNKSVFTTFLWQNAMPTKRSANGVKSIGIHVIIALSSVISDEIHEEAYECTFEIGAHRINLMGHGVFASVSTPQ